MTTGTTVVDIIHGARERIGFRLISSPTSGSGKIHEEETQGTISLFIYFEFKIMYSKYTMVCNHPHHPPIHLAKDEIVPNNLHWSDDRPTTKIKVHTGCTFKGGNVNNFCMPSLKQNESAKICVHEPIPGSGKPSSSTIS